MIQAKNALIAATADDIDVHLSLYSLPEIPRTEFGRRQVSGYSRIEDLWDRHLDGLIVTVPFKQRMLQFAARLGATGQTVGAVNALRREADGSWSGDMFDGLGFVRGAARKGERLRGRQRCQEEGLADRITERANTAKKKASGTG